MATNVTVAFTAGHFVETWRRFANLYVAMLPGIAVGVYLLMWIAQAFAVKTLGIIVIAYASMTLASSSDADIEVCREGPSSPYRVREWRSYGLTGSQVMPLFPYMMSLDLDPSRLVQAINLAVTVASVFLAIGLIYAGIMTPELMGVSILAIVPAIVGTQLGTRTSLAHSRQSQFRSVVLYVLLATGRLLLVRS